MTYLAASISEYLIQANIVLTICILIVLAFRFIMRKNILRLFRVIPGESWRLDYCISPSGRCILP